MYMQDVPAVLGQVGGIFALLTFNHFIADWVFQTHREASQKASNGVVRSIHCFIYSLLMLPLLWVLLDTPTLPLIWVLLFISHWFIDTYEPVWWWLKYIRRYPEAPSSTYSEILNKDPLVLILSIVVDQLLHLGVLLYIAVGVVLG